MMRFLRSLLHWLLLCALLIGSITPALAQDATPTPEPEEELFPVADGIVTWEEIFARSAALEPLVADLRGELDPTEFDLDELSFDVGFDAETAVDWVREHIAFQQYPGILRGARGALLSRAGNSIDLALLTARLLADAGYEVQIARTVLSEDDAALLLAQMAASVTPATGLAVDDLGALVRTWGEASAMSEEEIDALVEAAATPADPTASDFYSATVADAELLSGLLDEAGIEWGAADAAETLLAEAQDYFWAEYRLDPDEPWTGAHIAFKDPADEPVALEATETFATADETDLPEDLFHRLRFSVILERKEDAQLVEIPIVDGLEGTAASLVGRVVSYHNYPASLSDLSADIDIDGALAQNSIFVPLLNGESIDGAPSFDLDGRTFDMSLGGDGSIIGVAQSVGNAAEEAAGLLDALDAPEAEETPASDGGEEANAAFGATEINTLTAIWLEYTLIAPDGSERTVRRPMMDRLGAENRAAYAAGEALMMAPGMEFPMAARALLTDYSILVLPGVYSEPYRIERNLARLQQDLALVNFVGEATAGGDAASLTEIPEEFTTPPAQEDVLYNALFSALDATDAELLTYRPAPALVVLEAGMRADLPEYAAFTRVDVIANPRRSFRFEEKMPVADPAASQRFGIWETYGEQARFNQGEVLSEFNAPAVIAAALAQDIELLALAPDDEEATGDVIAGLPISLQAQQDLAADLAAGHWVVTPAALPDGFAQLGWWRIDPLTGVTLGIGEGGYGAEAIEYTFLQSVIWGAPKNLAGFAICKAQGNGTGCCLADAAIGFGAFALLGFGVARAAGQAAAVLVDVLGGAGVLGAGAANALPSTCNIGKK